MAVANREVPLGIGTGRHRRRDEGATGECDGLVSSGSGVHTPETLGQPRDERHLEGVLDTIDIVEAAKKYVPEMKEAGADLVVAVPHSGLTTADRLGGDENAAYYLADVSTNGVYLNEEEEPLGKGNPRRLFHGDRIRMGDFEFEVTLDEGEDLDMPPPEPMTVVPDHIEQLVDEESLKSGIQMLDEDEITGGDVIHNALFGEAAAEEEEDPVQKMDNQPNPFAPPPSNEQQKMMDAAEPA